MDEKNPKMSLYKRIENIWYHYKPVVLIAAGLLVVAAVCTVQSLTKREQDAIVYHIGMHGITASSMDDFRKSMAIVADDYNGDGDVIIDYKEEIYVPNEAAALNQPVTVERFNLELAFGECVVYIMDKSFYEGNRDYMTPLADVFDEVPSYAFDEKAFRLGDLPAYERLAGLHDLGEDSYLCLRLPRSDMPEQKYTQNVSFFKALAMYGAEEE